MQWGVWNVALPTNPWPQPLFSLLGTLDGGGVQKSIECPFENIRKNDTTDNEHLSPADSPHSALTIPALEQSTVFRWIFPSQPSQPQLFEPHKTFRSAQLKL